MGWNPIALKALVLAHVGVYRLTGGAIGGRFGRAPILLLTTVGRKSGERRTVPVQYLADGPRLVVVATNDGSQKHPDWYHNLLSRPSAEVEIGRDRRNVRARVASDEERAALWPRLVEMYPNYERDQARTSRSLPVVVLE